MPARAPIPSHPGQGAASTVRAVIRGETPVSALRKVGVRVSATTDFTVVPTLDDIAAGLLRYAAKPRGARNWGELLLHASFIDIRPEAASPEWDALLEGIWEAASGCPIPERAVAASRAVLAPWQ